MCLPSRQNANGATCTGIRIVECHWILHGMTVEVLADADIDIIVLHLAEISRDTKLLRNLVGYPIARNTVLTAQATSSLQQLGLERLAMLIK
jgi:hypothetical protein